MQKISVQTVSQLTRSCNPSSFRELLFICTLTLGSSFGPKAVSAHTHSPACSLATHNNIESKATRRKISSRKVIMKSRTEMKSTQFLFYQWSLSLYHSPCSCAELKSFLALISTQGDCVKQSQVDQRLHTTNPSISLLHIYIYILYRYLHKMSPTQQAKTQMKRKTIKLKL